MLSLLAMLVAYCGIDGDELEGVTLPSYMFAELQEAGELTSGDALVWEFSLSKQCLEREEDQIPVGAVSELKETGLYEDSCLLMAIRDFDETDPLLFVTNLDVRSVVAHSADGLVQWTHWRNRAAMKIDPFSDSHPTCLEVDIGGK